MTSLSEASEKISTIENQNKKIMKQLLIMEKRRKDDNKELVDMLKVNKKQEDTEAKNEGVEKDIIGKGTPDETQQVELFLFYFKSELILMMSTQLSMSHLESMFVLNLSNLGHFIKK